MSQRQVEEEHPIACDVPCFLPYPRTLETLVPTRMQVTASYSQGLTVIPSFPIAFSILQVLGFYVVGKTKMFIYMSWIRRARLVWRQSWERFLDEISTLPLHSGVADDYHVWSLSELALAARNRAP